MDIYDLYMYWCMDMYDQKNNLKSTEDISAVNSFGSKTDQAQRTNGNVLVAKGQTTKQWYHQWTPIADAARNHA